MGFLTSSAPYTVECISALADHFPIPLFGPSFPFPEALSSYPQLLSAEVPTVVHVAVLDTSPTPFSGLRP